MNQGVKWTTPVEIPIICVTELHFAITQCDVLKFPAALFRILCHILFLMMLPSFGLVEADGHSVGKMNHKTFTVGFV